MSDVTSRIFESTYTNEVSGQPSNVPQNQNFFTMLCQQNPNHIALVEDGISFSYGDLISLIRNRCAQTPAIPAHGVFFIRQQRILPQLVDFFACQACGAIPVILPLDAPVLPPLPDAADVPPRACMAVMTSGTTGIPKLLYRTYESWAKYFPIQNQIFGIHEDSRLFAQGNLSFTGNLNLYMAQFSIGATVVAQNRFWPREWESVIAQQEINAIYLIPSKLMCLPKILRRPYPAVRTILSGSQSLGKDDTTLLKQYFPNARVTLYYGASELNYITYVTDRDMTDDRNLIGKPFPGVQVTLQNGEFFVTTPYHVEGISCPYSLRDCGYCDDAGNFYFAGRGDDIVNIRGRKISRQRIERALTQLPGVREAAVISCRGETEYFLEAFVTLQEDTASHLSDNTMLREISGNASGKPEVIEQNETSTALPDVARLRKALQQHLAHYEMPRHIHILEQMPHTDSGKIRYHALLSQTGNQTKSTDKS